jgi:hypothetical protein
VLLEARYARYRTMGEFAVAAETGEPQPERPGIVDRIRRLLESGRAALVGGDGDGGQAADAWVQDAADDASPGEGR